MFKKLLLAAVISLSASSAFAACTSPLVVKDASGNSINMSVTTGADGYCQYKMDWDTSSQAHTDATSVGNVNIYQGGSAVSASNPSIFREADGTRSRVLDPCESNTQSYAPISITTATTTRIVAPSASNKTYICSLFLTSAAADNVGIVEGTGGTCGTGTAGVVGGTTAANGPNFAANGGVMMQAGGKTAVAQTAGTNVDLCLITSAATPLAGGIKYVQAP